MADPLDEAMAMAECHARRSTEAALGMLQLERDRLQTERDEALAKLEHEEGRVYKLEQDLYAAEQQRDEALAKLEACKRALRHVIDQDDIAEARAIAASAYTADRYPVLRLKEEE